MKTARDMTAGFLVQLCRHGQVRWANACYRCLNAMVEECMREAAADAYDKCVNAAMSKTHCSECEHDVTDEILRLAAPTETHASARSWTFEETVAACKNIGYDLSCGACAELFSTGVRLHEHDAGCATVGANRGGVVVIETHASDTKEPQ